MWFVVDDGVVLCCSCSSLSPPPAPAAAASAFFFVCVVLLCVCMCVCVLSTKLFWRSFWLARFVFVRSLQKGTGTYHLTIVLFFSVLQQLY